MIILNFYNYFILEQCNENKRKLVGELAVSFQPSVFVGVKFISRDFLRVVGRALARFLKSSLCLP
tara:strand:+ start:6138 stop:6332 length:195 start_codon:yes stop_codon:yes gene_type:complete